eukprot:NODE_2564_length_1390_cov_59.355170_g2437_i0.p1 GENE.NODE_2564_length_1390_cov_59.355170_g2437_i0~~NODE_2564_length_1390_cov_59.355170_g2437_i0.p1  ORF type:complete len:322 (+),score=58.33 NODE_2564_length_1390_cov_59.355170_g2437_i0:333-1298(+)
MAVPRLNHVNGQEAIRACIGPMARSVEDLNLTMKIWCQEKMWKVDPTVPPCPWRTEIYESKRKLRFGYFTNDTWFDPAPACARAVTETVAALKRAGHEVVEVKFADLYDLALNFVSILAADGKMKSMVLSLEGEKLHEMYHLLHSIAHIPSFLRPIIAGISRLLGKKRMGDLTAAACAKDTFEFWEALAQRSVWKKKVIKQWQDMKLDALICPGLGLPAWPHFESKTVMQACSYTFLWNNLHFPAGTVPVTYVQQGEEAYSSDKKDKITNAAIKCCENTAGLPIGVQVVTLPHEDELCLKAMRDVESVVGFTFNCPGAAQL